jgi:hypothetical protein
MTEIHDLLELALRLEHHRLEQREHVLIRRGNPARDGPRRSPDTLRPETRRSGPPGASQHEKRIFDWKSKGF